MKIDSRVSMVVAVRPMRLEDAVAVTDLSCQVGYPTTVASPAKATALFDRHILEMQVDDAVQQIQGLR